MLVFTCNRIFFTFCYSENIQQHRTYTAQYKDCYFYLLVTVKFHITVAITWRKESFIKTTELNIGKNDY